MQPKILVAQKIVVEYLSFQPGDFRPLPACCTHATLKHAYRPPTT